MKIQYSLKVQEREELIMNILVIGNGFDLAHGLPTKYIDFLFFCSIVLKIIKENHIEVSNNIKDYGKWIKDYKRISISDSDAIFNFVCNECERNITERDKRVYKDIYIKIVGKDIFWEWDEPDLAKEYFYLIYNNIWIEYFLQCDMHGAENWIDFESEISKVIQSLDNDMHKMLNDLDDIICDLSNGFLKKKYLNYIDVVQPINNGCLEITYREIRDKLLHDLNILIYIFQFYLLKYVEKIDCKLVSPDIQKIISNKSMKANNMPVDDTYVLPFNYTNTFQRLYIDKEQGNKYFEKNMDYIHGKVNNYSTIRTNNMVLGIDEYLSDDRKNKQVEFIAFKKFYQRIHKQTGCKYKEWVDKIRQDYFDYLQKIETAKYKELQYIPDKTQRFFNKHAMQAIKCEKCQMHNLYIFGHSLDITDKDILRDLILNDNVYTTIFYYDKDVMGQQIANLVKVIGQDELIRRTGGSTKTIEFKQQQPMISIDGQ